MEQVRVILASASPRRKELMRQIGIDFTVMVSDKEEEPASADPEKVCLEEAVIKAGDVAEKAQTIFPNTPMVIIGADTVVACDGRILGKPKDRDDAASMLRQLSGKTHQVYTGVCAIYCGGAQRVLAAAQNDKAGQPVLTEDADDVKSVVFTDCTDVTVAQLSEEAIEDYLNTDEPYDKAGAYGIQGYFARYVEEIRGDYNNVVGLPAGRVFRECLVCMK